MTDIFKPWLQLWDLTPDGPEIETHAARLLPVQRQGRPAMLKLATTDEERRGARVLRWFGPEVGAAVQALDGDAVLMARGETDLVALALANDAEATQVLCDLAARLHRLPLGSAPQLLPLRDWFGALTGAEGRARFPHAAAMANDLLDSTDAPVPLHGDLHHGNLLRFGPDWRVIDPKGLSGDPCFDFVQMFYNPDAIDRGHGVAIRPGVFSARLKQISEAASLNPTRLRKWIEAHAALSQCWAAPGDDVTLAASIGALARQTR